MRQDSLINECTDEEVTFLSLRAICKSIVAQRNGLTHRGSMNTCIAVIKKSTIMQQQKAAPLRFSFSEE